MYVPAVVVLGREQLLVGHQWSWMPCCGFASQLTRVLCVSHPPGWDPSCTSLPGHQGWHITLQNPRLVSGRTHGGAAAGRKKPALILLVLSTMDPPGIPDNSEDTPLSLCSIPWRCSLPQPPGVVQAGCLTPQPSCAGVLGLARLGASRVCRSHAAECVRRVLLPGCQAALSIYLHILTHSPRAASRLLQSLCGAGAETSGHSWQRSRVLGMGTPEQRVVRGWSWSQAGGDKVVPHQPEGLELSSLLALSAWLQSPLAEGLAEQEPYFFPGVALFGGRVENCGLLLLWDLSRKWGKWSQALLHLSHFSPLAPQGFVPLSVSREDGLVSSTAPAQKPCIELFSVFRTAPLPPWVPPFFTSLLLLVPALQLGRAGRSSWGFGKFSLIPAGCGGAAVLRHGKKEFFRAF